MLNDFKNKIDALRAMDFANDLKEIIVENSEVLINMQRDQWSKGKDRNDKPTTLDNLSYYTVFTFNYKAKYGSGLGAINDRITGFMTGALYNYVSLSVTKSDFAFTSEVSYWDDLFERTGDQWPGINPGNRLKFAQEIVVPAERQKFKERMGFK
jgi:hypothetical protein